LTLAKLVLRVNTRQKARLHVSIARQARTAKMTACLYAPTVPLEQAAQAPAQAIRRLVGHVQWVLTAHQGQVCALLVSRDHTQSRKKAGSARSAPREPSSVELEHPAVHNARVVPLVPTAM